MLDETDRLTTGENQGDKMATEPQIISREIEPTPIDGLFVITIKQITEGRGTIRESFRKSAFSDVSAEVGPWAQVNITETRQGAIRGLHAENMNKLVGIVAGEGFGAYVDLRPDSPTKGAVFTTELVPGKQVFVPKGVGNGFQSTSETPSQYLYLFDEEWVPGMSGSAVNPLDPELGIDWPIKVDDTDPTLVSAKDASAPLLRDIFSQ